MNKKEQLFRKNNSDCYIPDDFSQVHREYANLPIYLRRWCKLKLIDICPICGWYWCNHKDCKKNKR